KDRWKPRAQGKRKDAHEIGDHELIDCNIKRVRISPERLEGRTEIRHSTDFQWDDFDAERASGSLGLAHLQHRLGIARVEDDCQRYSMEMFRFPTKPNSRRGAKKAAVHGQKAEASAPRKPIVGSFPACCAPAASGHAAAPPSSVMKSRRFT